MSPDHTVVTILQVSVDCSIGSLTLYKHFPSVILVIVWNKTLKHLKVIDGLFIVTTALPVVWNWVRLSVCLSLSWCIENQESQLDAEIKCWSLAPRSVWSVYLKIIPYLLMWENTKDRCFPEDCRIKILPIFFSTSEVMEERICGFSSRSVCSCASQPVTHCVIRILDLHFTGRETESQIH